MRDQLLRLAERAESAVASATGVIGDENLSAMRRSIDHLRQRLAYPTDLAVAVLAGGTGSGKSSIFNVLVGEEVADVGGVRPTTSSPIAAVPEGLEQSIEGLLDHLGVSQRHLYEGAMCVIDLPDYDSVETANRQIVDEILPLVDVVVWVLDPEKYRDARLHHDYLEPLNSYADQFIFVVNQVDRLDGDATDLIIKDLRLALGEDGIEDPVVLAISAAPSAGPPVGVDDLVSAIHTKSSDGAGLRKLVTDLAVIASNLSSQLGSGLDFDEQAGAAVSVAVDHILADDLSGATGSLVSFVNDTGDAASGPIGLEIRSQASQIPRHVARIVEEATPDPIRTRFGRVKESPGPDRSLVRMKLAAEVIRPVRALLAKRAVAVAAIAEFVVEAQPRTDTDAD